jgi:hypothetical protein
MISQVWNYTSRITNGCWKNLYTECVQHAFEEFNINSVYKEMQILLKLPVDEVEDDDDDGNLLDSHSQPLNDEELAESDQLTLEGTRAAADDDGNLLDSHSQPLNDEELAESDQLTLEGTRGNSQRERINIE